MKFNIKFLFIVFLLVFAFSSFGYSDLTTGLVSYWRFDETSGTTASDSHSNNNLIHSNTGVITSNGKIDYSLNFNGNTYYSQASSKFTPKGAKTFSSWVYHQTSTSSQHVFTTEGGSTSNHGDAFIILTNNIVRWSSHKGIGGSRRFLVESDSALNTNAWNHIVLTWDGTTNSNAVKIYINGELDAQGTANAVETADVFQNFLIGIFRPGFLTEIFNGRIDETAIWNRALSQAEITELYNSGSGLQYPFYFNNLTITSKDILINTDLSNFTAIINNIEYNTTNGTIITEIKQNDINLYNITIIADNYYNRTYFNYNVSEDGFNFTSKLLKESYNQDNELDVKDILKNITISTYNLTINSYNYSTLLFDYIISSNNYYNRTYNNIDLAPLETQLLIKNQYTQIDSLNIRNKYLDEVLTEYTFNINSVTYGDPNIINGVIEGLNVFNINITNYEITDSNNTWELDQKPLIQINQVWNNNSINTYNINISEKQYQTIDGDIYLDELGLQNFIIIKDNFFNKEIIETLEVNTLYTYQIHQSEVNFNLIDVVTKDLIHTITNINITDGNITQTYSTTNGTINIKILADEYNFSFNNILYSEKNQTINFNPLEKKTINIKLNRILNFILYNERTLELFDVGSTNITRLTLFCLSGETKIINVLSNNFSSDIACPWDFIKIDVAYENDLYFRTIIPDYELNLFNIYLMDIRPNYEIGVLTTITINDLVGGFDKGEVRLTRWLQNGTKEIIAQKSNVEQKVFAYLLKDEVYTISIKSNDGKEVRNLGYLLGEAGSKTITISQTNYIPVQSYLGEISWRWDLSNTSAKLTYQDNSSYTSSVTFFIYDKNNYIIYQHTELELGFSVFSFNSLNDSYIACFTAQNSFYGEIKDCKTYSGVGFIEGQDMLGDNFNKIINWSLLILTIVIFLTLNYTGMGVGLILLGFMTFTLKFFGWFSFGNPLIESLIITLYILMGVLHIYEDTKR